MAEPSAPSDPGAAIAGRLRVVRETIARACERSGRRPEDVRVVAITKTVATDVILEARAVGLEDFGENYARDLAAKAPAIPARWHFVGALQRGTAHLVATHAHIVHSAVPARGLERLARHAHGRGRTIDCLVQVDFSGRRNGLAPERAMQAADRVAELEGVRLAG